MSTPVGHEAKIGPGPTAVNRPVGTTPAGRHGGSSVGLERPAQELRGLRSPIDHVVGPPGLPASPPSVRVNRPGVGRHPPDVVAVVGVPVDPGVADGGGACRRRSGPAGRRGCGPTRRRISDWWPSTGTMPRSPPGRSDTTGPTPGSHRRRTARPPASAFPVSTAGPQLLISRWIATWSSSSRTRSSSAASLVLELAHVVHDLPPIAPGADAPLPATLPRRTPCTLGRWRRGSGFPWRRADDGATRAPRCGRSRPRVKLYTP